MCAWCDLVKVPNDKRKTRPMPVPWGLSVPMCESALQKIVADMCDLRSTVQEGFVRDYAKLCALILDAPTIDVCLRELDDEIASPPPGSQPETNWLRLSSILTSYEKKCWFPTDVLLPLGILSDDDFAHYVRCGYVLKDYGAGVKHGEFTHRLQWHVIMRVVTERFTKPVGAGWDHSPFQLFISLGRPQNKTIWWYILDQSGDGTFQHPDSLHAHVLNNAIAFPKLAAFLAKREAKRRAEFVGHIVGYIAYRRSIGDVINVPLAYSTTSNPFDSHDAFKDFESWFVNEVLRKRFSESTVKAVHDGLSNMPAKDYLAKKTADVGSLTTAPKHRSTPYVPAVTGAVYKLTAASLMDEAAAQARALRSRTALFVT